MEQKYLPLFRKYRPQSFKDIVGQENLVKALTNAIELNRIANAYLFCGPRGTGKTSSARIFAKSLNCKNGPTTKPCQKCNSCIDITNATGLDVIEIDAASNRGIQDAKELIQQVQYAPVNGKYKIFIIDEVHMLSNDAFNALLKTFEEPPLNVIFILATTEPHKVLETIVSRCQRFDLRRITTEDIVKRLREISDLENIKITDDALFTIAKNVSGGLRDSLALLDQVSILGIKDEITSQMIEELIGKINFDVLLNLLNDILKSDIENVIKDIEQIYSKGNEPRNLIENFIEFLRNVILILNSSDDETTIKLTGFIKENIDKIKALDCKNKDTIIKILNILIEYYKEIKVSTNPYLWMELAAISASRCDLSLNQVQSEPIKHIQGVSSKQVQNTVQIENEAQPSKVQNVVQPVSSKVQNNFQTENKLEPSKVQNTIQAESIKEIQNQPQAPKANPTNETIEKPDNTSTQNPIRNIETPGQAPNVVQGEVKSANIDNCKKDSAEVWMEIVQNISSLPARAFYSGVAKLVGIKDKKIVLGFLHDNTLNQAKTASKISQLDQAVKKVCPDYVTEFRKITQDTKTIEIKHKPIPRQPDSVSFNPPPQKEKPKGTIEQESPKPNEETKREARHYSTEVQQMLDEFSGTIIEE